MNNIKNAHKWTKFFLVENTLKGKKPPVVATAQYSING